MNARDKLIQIYLEYINNYLSVECYADQNGLHENDAQELVSLARRVYNSDHPDE